VLLSESENKSFTGRKPPLRQWEDFGFLVFQMRLQCFYKELDDSVGLFSPLGWPVGTWSPGLADNQSLGQHKGVVMVVGERD
tara:strand:- start:383 stop:628 length:246 start_codon:yes stop_codon:yes gene_type:complete